jgi:glutathione S-transferase
MRRLITIPISHYCEKARWALDFAGLSFVEEAHVQVVHWLAVRRAGGKRTAPVLVCEEGVFPESGAIVGYAARHAPAECPLEPADPVLRAEAMRLERWFDLDLGPHARRLTYFHLQGEREIARAYNLTGVPAFERAAFPVAFAPLLGVVTRVLDVRPQTAAESRVRDRAVFDAVGERLADGRRFLVGDRFSRADLAFAALAAPMLLPERYGVPLPGLDELPAAMAEDTRGFRELPAGAFALRMYERFR